MYKGAVRRKFCHSPWCLNTAICWNTLTNLYCQGCTFFLLQLAGWLIDWLSLWYINSTSATQVIHVSRFLRYPPVHYHVRSKPSFVLEQYELYPHLLVSSVMFSSKFVTVYFLALLGCSRSKCDWIQKLQIWIRRSTYMYLITTSYSPSHFWVAL
jgi:hypothetical protein